MYIFYAVLGCSLAFVRIVPVEDWIGRFRERTKATVREKGYDAQPAPLWSYVFLVGFLALIVFIGWKVMYAD